jgi:hypothetical protein
MQYDQHQFGDFVAVASGLPLASSFAQPAFTQPSATAARSTATVSGRYAETLEQAFTGQILTLDPGLCGTSSLAATEEQRGFRVSDADKEPGLEVDLAKNSQVRPPPAKNKKPTPKAVVKVLGN